MAFSRSLEHTPNDAQLAILKKAWDEKLARLKRLGRPPGKRMNALAWELYGTAETATLLARDQGGSQTTSA